MFFCHDHVVQGVLCKGSFDHFLHVNCDHAESRAFFGVCDDHPTLFEVIDEVSSLHVLLFLTQGFACQVVVDGDHRFVFLVCGPMLASFLRVVLPKMGIQRVIRIF